MKKIILSISIMAIVAGVFYSCTKEDSMTKGKVKTTVDNPQMGAEDLRVENLIVNFKEKVDFYRANTNLKSGESKSVDSTVWYLEAAANYTYADASFTEDKYIVDSAFIEVPVSNGEVNMSDIQVAFDELSTIISDKYADIDASEKQLILADVSTKEVTDDKVTLKVTTGIGAEKSAPPPVFEGWIWGFLQGTCADPQPLYGGTNDAGTILTKRANWTIKNSVPNNLYYFTSVQTVYDLYPSMYPIYIDNNPNQWGFYNSRLFGLNDPEMDICIPSDAMSYYYDMLFEIAEMDEIKPDGLELGKFYCRGDFAGPNDRWHVLDITYGEWHIKGNSTE